jgi:hypothetical protein
MRRHSFIAVCFFALTGLLGASISAQAIPGPRVPKGIYTNFLLDDAINQAETAAYPGGLPAYPNPAADAILVKYFSTLLDNPAISGLAPMMGWTLLNPNDPGPDPFHPAAGAYTWNAMDDVFIAVDEWNRSHPAIPPKTIQIILSPGFSSPSWVFSNIDSSVCGDHSDCAGAGSCDGLFMSAPANPTSRDCGYTTLFFRVESNPVEQIPLPMPWNSVYKSDWRTFLIALNQHVQWEPASYAFVSIAMAGPTASSTEMILPNTINQNPYVCSGGLYLDETFRNNGNPFCPPALPEFSVPAAWNLLFANFYGPDPKYQNTDLPFIQEWDAAIDEYSWIFNGTTLVLTATTDALPTFPDADPSLLIPAPGFVADCGNDPLTNPSGYDPSSAMACAAVTQVLAHFTNPFVGGFNAKATFEAGMTAARDGIDLGTNGFKWLAAITASGRAPLPGTPFRMSRMLGGVQFAQIFSDPKDILPEGCPDYGPFHPSPPSCNGLTPGEGLENVLSISFFPGTSVGPFFCPYTTDSGMFVCAPTTIDDTGGAEGNFVYSNAPVNFLEIYQTDIIYASGMSNCNMLQIAGNPDEHVPPTCVPAITSDVALTQTELNIASQKLLSIAESIRFW